MNPYPFSHTGELSYEFLTSNGIVYKARFFDYSYLFASYPEFSKNVYSFTLEVLLGDINNLTYDDKVGETVVSIFYEFFKTSQHFVIYVCDSSDERHLARKKKFDLWFWKYNDGTIVKEDGIAVIADFEIYNSLLIHKENKLADKIIQAFKTLNERADDK